MKALKTITMMTYTTSMRDIINKYTRIAKPIDEVMMFDIYYDYHKKEVNILKLELLVYE